MPKNSTVNIKNTADLRKMLLEIIDDVRTGDCDVKNATAINLLAGQILASARLDLDAARYEIVVPSLCLTSGNDMIEDKSEPETIENAPQEEENNDEDYSPPPPLNETVKEQVLRLKSEGKNLASVHEIINSYSDEERRKISLIYLGKAA